MGTTPRVSRKPLAFAIAMAFASSGAHAAAITVTDGGDAGTGSTCTLRQAIESANNDSAGNSTCAPGNGADVISFSSTLQNSTITLQQGQLDVSSPMTINGGGVTVDANQASRVMAVYYHSPTLTNVTLASLTLTNGNLGTIGAGGGICATMFTCNSGEGRPTGQRGAAQKAPQTAYAVYLTLDHAEVNSNTASYKAGGIYLDRYVSLSMNDSTVSNNSLTALDDYGSGGIYVSESAYLLMTNSTVSGNSASGNQGFLTGGIYAYASYVYIANSTISGNGASCTSACAGALSISGGNPPASAYLYDSTVSGNSATSTGGNSHDVGGAIVGAFATATINLANTILTGNSGDYADLYIPAGSASASASLLGTALSSYSGNGNLFNDNPVLGPLQNNGGPTMTRALLTGSPAIDTGNNALIYTGLTNDQRGAGYSRIINGTVDIGAYEFQAAAPAPAPKPVPTLSSWAMTLLGGLLAVLGIARERRRRSG